jgi:hypothetical protein
MKDSFLNQPITTYDWRRGLPSGIKDAEVYNKVGWAHSGSGKLWNFYHDAAILVMLDPDTLRERHYIAVVMTSQSYIADIQELGKRIENNLIADQ